MIRVRYILFLLLCLFATQILFPADSVKTYTAKEIVVFGERVKIEERLLPSPIIILSGVQLQQSSGTSVASKLQHIPGVFLRGYGGNGSLHTISTRGMSGEHTKVLVDGEEFSSVQNGLVDLGIFLVDDVEQIEIAKGGFSSLVGSNAVSGVVNIVTKKPTKEIHASLSSSLGSFGFQEHSVAVSGGSEFVRARGMFSVERARNDYNFSFFDGLETFALQREGADYVIRNSIISVLADLADNVHQSFSARYSFAERGSPSSVTSPYQNNLSRLSDDNLFLTSMTRWKYFPATTLSVNARFQYFYQYYRDPNYITTDGMLKSESYNRVGGISLTMNHSFSEYHSFVGGIEASYALVNGSKLTTKTRMQESAFISSQHHFVELMDVAFYPSLRLDMFDKMPSSLNPKLGVNIQLMNIPEVRLRGTVGKNYRVPTFNELYWAQDTRVRGNPNLKPEQSFSSDIGLLAMIDEIGRLKFELNYFWIDTKDRIVWTPGANGVWSPMNVYRVTSSGVEVEVNHSLFDDQFVWSASYSLMEVLRNDIVPSQTNNKKLPYTPQELAMVMVRWNVAPVSFSLTHSFTGFRYINENNNPKFILPEFQRTDAVILTRIVLVESAIVIKGEINNIFNSQYQWIASFPVPGRSYALNITFHY